MSNVLTSEIYDFIAMYYHLNESECSCERIEHVPYLFVYDLCEFVDQFIIVLVVVRTFKDGGWHVEIYKYIYILYICM